jgi:threonine/homoserine/homoserine lactone efflux protein
MQIKARLAARGDLWLMQDPYLFSLAVLAILGTPGPTNTLLATSGALVGFRRSLPLIAAEIGGYLIAITVLHAVLAGVLDAHPWIKTALRLAIGAYLLIVAFELWRRRDTLEGARSAIGFQRVFITTLLNPKAIVFAFGIIPRSQPHALLYVLAFVGFVLIAALSWILVGALIAGATAAHGNRLVSRLSAVVLVGFAGLIAAG